MAPIHPFATANSTKFDSLFDEQPLNVASPASLREGGSAPDFRDRTPESSEDLVFENLFDQAGGNVTGSLSGDRAVPFFQRSGLDSNTLYKIWQLADSSGEGVLRLSGFKVAMKLIALAQSQLPVSVAYIREACPLPIFEGIRISLSRPKAGSEGIRLGGRASSLSRSSPFESTSPFDRLPSSSWNQSSQGQYISLTDSQKYYRIFRKASFNQDFLDGNAVRDIMMKSGLSVDILRDIWNLADTQDRGFLEAFEFIIAMFYVENFMNETISDVPILLPLKIKESAILAVDSFTSPYPNVSRQPSFAQTTSRSMYSGPSSERNAPPLNLGLNTNRDPIIAPINPTSASEPPWSIPQAERVKYYGFFDSIVSVPTALMPSDKAYVFFIKSQLPSTVLSQIWELATIENQSGLSRDEFAVAMHLIYSQLAGQMLPSQLPLNLIPPRFRKRDPYSQETPGSTVPFDPFIDNITNRQNNFGGVNSLNASSFEHSVHQSDISYSKSEDLLSFDDPSEIVNDSTTNYNSNFTSQSTSFYKPTSFNQNRDVKNHQNELTQSMQSFNNQHPSVADTQGLSATIPSQPIHLDHGFNQEPMKHPELMRDNPSIQNSFQDIPSESIVPQKLHSNQHQPFSIVQEVHQQGERQNLNDLTQSQKVEGPDQTTLQKIPQLNDQLSALSMPPDTSLKQAPVELAPSFPLVEDNKIPDSKQNLDPFAALIENRTHSVVINNDSKEPVTSFTAEADPFLDPTMEIESKQKSPHLSTLIEQSPTKDTKHLSSFDELIAHRSVESNDTKPRFASFDDIILRDTAINTNTHHEVVSEPLADSTDQVVSSPLSMNNLQFSSKISPTAEASPKSEQQTKVLQPSGEVPSSSLNPLENLSQNTSADVDPFLALVQPVESKSTDSKQSIDIPNETSFPSPGSIIFSAFGDSKNDSQTLSTLNINTSDNLVAYLATVDPLSWSKTDLASSEGNSNLPELTYAFSDSLFGASALEFPPPKPMSDKEEFSSMISISKEIPLTEISNLEPVSKDPFASIANRTDPFDLPEAALDKMVKRASAAASLRFDDAFGDDFSLPNNKNSAEQTTEPVLDSVDRNTTIDPSHVTLPVSSTSLSLSAFKDPSTPEACRSASLYFDADDVYSSHFSASSATDFPNSSPQVSDAISILIAMGFAPNAAADALARFDNDTDKATHYLLDNQSSSLSPDTLS